MGGIVLPNLHRWSTRSRPPATGTAERFGQTRSSRFPIAPRLWPGASAREIGAEPLPRQLRERPVLLQRGQSLVQLLHQLLALRILAHHEVRRDERDGLADQLHVE